ncbi:MAG: porin family protein, partial [Gemmatimonadota bacterium]
MRPGKTVLLAVLVLASTLATGPAQGQSRPHFGPMAGMSLARLHGMDDSSTGSRTGFVAGGFVDIPLGERLGFEPELLYVQKGARTDINGGLQSTLKLDYLELPLLLKLLLPTASSTRVGPNFFAGPAIGFKVGCAVSSHQQNGPPMATSQNCTDGGPSVRSTDLSLVFGLGL